MQLQWRRAVLRASVSAVKTTGYALTFLCSFSALGAAACGSAGTGETGAPSSPDVSVVTAPPATTSPGSGETAPATPTRVAAGSTSDMRARGLVVTGSVTTTLADHVHTAVAKIVVNDADGRPAAGVHLQGTFTGGIHSNVIATTGDDGIATAVAEGEEAHMIVGFTVTSATSTLAERTVVEVPTGGIAASPCCPPKTDPTM